jgi:hypothetical protein
MNVSRYTFPTNSNRVKLTAHFRQVSRLTTESTEVTIRTTCHNMKQTGTIQVCITSY